jgi:phosphoserine phosphatase RsbU/P
VTGSATAERILVVEDEPALAAAMARALASRGIEADVALSGTQARELFEARDYALALLDVRLPDESGYGLLVELRRRRPDTAVVMISAVDDPELGRAALEHGAYGYLIKPVGATQLYLVAVNNLRRRTLELENRANLARLEAMLAERAEQMRRAAELQAGMLPRSPLKEAGFELAASFAAAREISGDFYDWWRAPGGRLTITLGDVMGKGLPAALMMASARAALRGAALIEDLGEGLAQAATVMAAALEVNDAYITLFHSSFDPASGELQYVDAGHGHARLLRRHGGQDLLAERCAPIGLLDGSSFKVGRAQLEPGDTLVVFSDGLFDLRPDLAAPGVQLPNEARRAGSAQELVEALAAGAAQKELSDDVTVVALKRL